MKQQKRKNPENKDFYARARRGGTVSARAHSAQEEEINTPECASACTQMNTIGKVLCSIF